MADIARLGFDIDTTQLARANTELRNLAATATQAEKAVSSLGTSSARAFQAANSAAAATNRSFAAANTTINATASAFAAATTAANSNATAMAAAAQAAARAAATQTAAATAARTSTAANSNLNTSLGGIIGSYRTLATIIGGIFVGSIAKAIDTYTQLQNTLSMVGVANKDVAATEDRLYEIANRNGQAIDDVQTTYRRASIAAKSFGMSQDDTMKLIEGVSASLKIQGTSARQAQGVLLQFTQALGSGTVRAEEFNSMMEGALPIAQAAARGWTGGAISVGELRNKMLAGSVTSKEFAESLKRGFDTTIVQANLMGMTISQSLTVLWNGFTRLVGAIDSVIGVSRILNGAFEYVNKVLNDMSKFIRDLTEVQIQEFISRATAAAVVMTTVLAPAFVALGIAGVTAMTRITIAMMKNPFVALAVAVTTILVLMYEFRDEISQMFGIDIVEEIKNAANVIIRTFVNMWIQIKFLWNNFRDVAAETWDAIVTYAAGVINPFVVKAITWFNDMMVKVTGIWNSLGTIVGDAIDSVIDFVVRTFTTFVQWGKAQVLDFAAKVSYVWMNFPQIMGNVLNAVTSFVSSAFDALVNWMLQKFKDLMAWGVKVKDWFVSLMTTSVEPFQLSLPDEIKTPPPDPQRDARLAAERARAEQERVMNNSRDYVNEVGAAYTKSTRNINENTDAVNKNNAANAKGKGKGGKEDPWAKIVRDAEQLIDKQALLESQLGATEIQMLALTKAAELFDKVEDAHIKKTPEVIAKVEELAAAYAKAKASLDAARAVFDFKTKGEAAVKAAEAEAAAVTMSTAAGIAYIDAQKQINDLVAKGIVLRQDQIDSINDTALATANATVETKRYTEVMKTVGDAAKGALKEFLKDIREGKDIWTAFGDAATRAMDKIISKLEDIAIDKLFDMFGSGGKAGTSATGTTGSGKGFFDSIADGIGSIFSKSSSSSSGGGWFSGIGDSLSNFFSSSPAVSSVPTSPDVMGPLQGSPAGFFNMDAGLTMGSFGASNAMGGVSALLGGFKAITAKNTKDMIGGIGQAVGGVLMMIPTPWTMAAGMVISLASSILPGLLGGTPATEYSSASQAINYSATGGSMGKGGYTTSGGVYGPAGEKLDASGPLSSLGKGMMAVFKTFEKGIVDTSKVWGVMMQQRHEKYGSGEVFQNATTYITGPGGERIQIGQGSDEKSIGLESAGVAALIKSIVGGAVGEISSSLKTAMNNFQYTGQEVFENTFEGLVKAIDFVRDAYDTLGLNTAVVSMMGDFKKINDTFKALETGAEALGLSLTPVQEAAEKARKDYAKQFMDPFNMIMDPVGTSFRNFADSAEATRLSLQYLIDQGLATATDMATVNLALLKKEAELKEQLYGVTVRELQDAINELTTGDLSNATAATAYAGLRAQFDATAAAALAGDTEASAELVQQGLELARAGQQQFGSGKAYEDLKATIEDVFSKMRGVIGESTGATPALPAGTLPPELAASYANTDRLNAIVNAQNEQIVILTRRVTDLIDVLQRTATNR